MHTSRTKWLSVVRCPQTLNAYRTIYGYGGRKTGWKHSNCWLHVLGYSWWYNSYFINCLNKHTWRVDAADYLANFAKSFFDKGHLIGLRQRWCKKCFVLIVPFDIDYRFLICSIVLSLVFDRLSSDGIRSNSNPSSPVEWFQKMLQKFLCKIR